MLKLQQEPTFEAPVQIHRPGRKPETIQIEFKALRKDEIEALSKKLMDRPLAAEDIVGIVADWKEVDAPFSAESLADLEQNYPFSIAAIWAAYNQAYIPNLQGN